jgi:hypothetical protein
MTFYFDFFTYLVMLIRFICKSAILIVVEEYSEGAEFCVYKATMFRVQ